MNSSNIIDCFEGFCLYHAIIRHVKNTHGFKIIHRVLFTPFLQIPVFFICGFIGQVKMQIFNFQIDHLTLRGILSHFNFLHSGNISSSLATMRFCSSYGGSGSKRCFSLSALMPFAVVPVQLSSNCC